MTYSNTKSSIKSNILGSDREKNNRLNTEPIPKNKSFIKNSNNNENKNISAIDHVKKIITDKFMNFNFFSHRNSVQKNETNENATPLKDTIKTSRTLQEVKDGIKKVVGNSVIMEPVSDNKTKFKCKKIIGKNIIKLNLYLEVSKNKSILSGEILEGELSDCEGIFAKIKEKLI